MRVSLESTSLPEVFVVRPCVVPDDRGFFTELFRRDEWESARREAVEGGEAGAEFLPTAFFQVNFSRSRFGVVRGLHVQVDPPMGKLMRVVRGKALVVAVDVRPESANFGKWEAVELDDREPIHLWAPGFFARGFCALSEVCEIEYLCTATYNAATEYALKWDDPALGLPMPVPHPIVSPKDQGALSLEAWRETVRNVGLRLQP